MKKNIILALSIITTLNIHAMHEEPMDIEENQPVQQLPCYLAMLPMDILDYIAHFLTFDDIESKEEFIERTKLKSNKIPKPYDKHLPKNEWGSGSKGTLIGYCPDETKVALLRLATPALTIIDEEKDELLHQTPLRHKNYQHIALSRCAHMFATINQDNKAADTNCRHEVKRYIITNYLTLKNIATQKTETIEISGGFSPRGFVFSESERTTNILAFKKEGTHIIMHGSDYELGQHHRIFPVTINESTTPSKKTLQYYFTQKKICKSIMGNNDSTKI